MAEEVVVEKPQYVKDAAGFVYAYHVGIPLDTGEFIPCDAPKQAAEKPAAPAKPAKPAAATVDTE